MDARVVIRSVLSLRIFALSAPCGGCATSEGRRLPRPCTSSNAAQQRRWRHPLSDRLPLLPLRAPPPPLSRFCVLPFLSLRCFPPLPPSANSRHAKRMPPWRRSVRLLPRGRPSSPRCENARRTSMHSRDQIRCSMQSSELGVGAESECGIRFVLLLLHSLGVTRQRRLLHTAALVRLRRFLLLLVCAPRCFSAPSACDSTAAAQ